MHLEYEQIDLINGKRGFTKSYINEIRCDLLAYVGGFSKKLFEGIGLELDLKLNESLFDQAIIDAIEDMKRLINFHPTKTPNAIKEAAYIAYWWLQRKPLTLSDSIIVSKLNISAENKLRLIFMNEYFLLAYIEMKVFDFSKDAKPVCNNPKIIKFETQWKQARRYILYFLVYRTKSPKSIEALLVTSTLHPIRALTDDFWQNEK